LPNGERALFRLELGVLPTQRMAPAQQLLIGGHQRRIVDEALIVRDMDGSI
jgi:hypothetical protein